MLSDNALRVQILPAVQSLVPCRKWRRSIDEGEKARRQQKEVREAVTTWMKQPLTDQDTFYHGLEKAMAYGGKNKTDFALSMGVPKQSLANYEKGFLPTSFAATRKALHNIGVPEAMHDKVHALYERESAVALQKRRAHASSHLNDHRRRASAGKEKYVRDENGFAIALTEALNEIGLTPSEFDARAAAMNNYRLETASWCGPAGGRPTSMTELLDALNQCGASDNAMTTVVQGYIATREHDINISRG